MEGEEKVMCQEICKEKGRRVAVTGDAGPLDWHLERWEDESCDSPGKRP